MADSDHGTFAIASNGHAAESSMPQARGDLLVRRYANESVVWSPVAAEPLYLGALSTVILELLDGSVSVGDLVGDLSAVLEFDRAFAHSWLQDELSMLDRSGLLATSKAAEDHDRHIDVFPAPPNP